MSFCHDRRSHHSRSTHRAVSLSTTTSPLTAVISSASTFYWTTRIIRCICTVSSRVASPSRHRLDFDRTPPSYTSHFVSSFWLCDKFVVIPVVYCFPLLPSFLLITLRAKVSGAVYCYRSCLFVCVCVCVYVCVCGSVTTITGNCVHRSSPNWICR